MNHELFLMSFFSKMRSLASIDAHDLFYCMVENIQGITIIYSLRLEISVCDLVKKLY
jgi:hypothetical protein